MIYDIQKMKDLGFNMIRKHIKIEPQRWYYHCDRIGMLVWQDMVNGGRDYKFLMRASAWALMEQARSDRRSAWMQGVEAFGLMGRHSA